MTRLSSSRSCCLQRLRKSQIPQWSHGQGYVPGSVSSEPKNEGVLYRLAVEIEIKGADKPAMVGEVLYLIF